MHMQYPAGAASNQRMRLSERTNDAAKHCNSPNARSPNGSSQVPAGPFTSVLHETRDPDPHDFCEIYRPAIRYPLTGVNWIIMQAVSWGP